MAELPLTKGHVAIVDDADFDWLSQWKWSANERRHRTRDGRSQVYAHRVQRINGRCTTIQLHRFVVAAPAGVIVDHANGWGLDCRRENLRLASPYLSAANRGALGTNRTGFIGVQLRRGVYAAHIRDHGKIISQYGFATAEAAAKAYDHLARLLRGEFAVLNFPEAQHG